MRSKAYIPEGLPPEVHRAYCEHIVSSFKDTTSDIVDLATLSAHLWGSYLEPIEMEKVGTMHNGLLGGGLNSLPAGSDGFGA